MDFGVLAWALWSAVCIAGMRGERSHDGGYYGRASVTDPAIQERSRDSMLCMDIRPQHMVNVDQLLGLWYGNEILMHTHDYPGVVEYSTCVLVHLNDITEQMRAQISHNYPYGVPYEPASSAYNPHLHQGAQKPGMARDENEAQTLPKYLRLTWHEHDEEFQYIFNYTDNQPGLWTNIGEQRVLSRNRYNQFNGSVQVVKAVHDHLVLTFCGNDLKSSIYTVVLSRMQNGLTAAELGVIRKMLKNRGLSTDSVRKVCVSAAMSGPSGSLLLLTGLLGIIVASTAAIGHRAN